MIALFAFCFAMFRELSEHSKDSRWHGYPDWFNTNKSWVNKHRWGSIVFPFLPEKLSKWIFYSPLVWVTDGEHFFQMLSYVSVLLSVYIATDLNQLHAVGYFALGHFLAMAVKELFLKNVQ